MQGKWKEVRRTLFWSSNCTKEVDVGKNRDFENNITSEKNEVKRQFELYLALKLFDSKLFIKKLVFLNACPICDLWYICNNHLVVECGHSYHPWCIWGTPIILLVVSFMNATCHILLNGLMFGAFSTTFKIVQSPSHILQRNTNKTIHVHHISQDVQRNISNQITQAC